MWLRKLIENHVLANLLFGLVLLLGTLTYLSLPREQDPTINFNWVQVTTFLPGASASDVEQKVTNLIEESIEDVQDIKFVSSSSRESISSILVRFNELDERDFDKRLADLRREINNIEKDLPEEAERPDIFEITSSNAFPTATVVISGPSDDENLRRQARLLEKDLARIKGVDRVQPTGLRDPEIQIRFDAERIQQTGISLLDVANSVRAFYRDTSAGRARIAGDQWLIRVEGTTTDPDRLAALPIIHSRGSDVEIRLGDVADVVTARARADRLVQFNGQPAVLFAVTKTEQTNLLDLVERISAFVDARADQVDQLGVEVTLVDDQTLITRNALDIMQTNALLGLILVLLVTWMFLGTRISMLVTIGIPFTLAGTFIALNLLDQTLNTSVLLGVVISLGMLVDDAVVVVESIYHKLRRGLRGIEAIWSGLTEVISPVTASVMTTIAAFMPLMLLPGILGKFMMVIPLVVTLALLVSLIEAYWMLPSHVLGARIDFDRPSRVDRVRERCIRWLKIRYGRGVVTVMRHPVATLLSLMLLVAGAATALARDVIKVDFFAADTIRLFYVNVEMPTTASLQDTMRTTQRVENQVSALLRDEEVRSVVSYSGQQFTEIEVLFADNLGQVLVSLKPRTGEMRTVESIIEALRPSVARVVGPVDVTFLKLSGGPPTAKPVSVKVRGDDYAELRAATDALTVFLKSNDAYVDVVDDDSRGRYGLNLQVNPDAVNRLGLFPDEIARTVRMLVDGEVISSLQTEGDRLIIRLQSQRAIDNRFDDIEQVLNLSIPTPSGSSVPLRELVISDVRQVKGNIRHYNFRRTITLESDIDKSLTDTVKANALIDEHWQSLAADFPGISLDFTGELDDIQESMDAIGILFLFGIGLMYLILSTQFQSYFQPLMMLFTIPMAFTGVIFGLLVSGNPLSLFTLYGIVALAGIAVNAAIVLISRANSNLDKGMSLIHATFYASRRRMLPILITTFTTVAGLLSLALGLGGKSLIWSPVATAIVWGLVVSSMLTLFVVPVLYQIFMQRSPRRQRFRRGG